MLTPTDRLAVVAPSGPFAREDLARGIAWWRERFDVLDLTPKAPPAGYLSAPDAERSNALLAAVRDPSVHAILCARGGYGASRILCRDGDALLAAVRAHPKPLVGYSDITALHAVWAHAGVRSVHGTMVAATGRGNPYSPHLADVLQGATPEAFTGLQPLRPGRANGDAAGGNLAVLCALLGTAYFPPVEGRVLFLEDVTERPYRVDRMLTSLKLAGVFSRVSAVILGDFVQCDPGPDGVTIDAVLREVFEDVRVPVVCGAPFGHGDRTAPWVYGAPVSLDADEGRVTFLEGLCARRNEEVTAR